MAKEHTAPEEDHEEHPPELARATEDYVWCPRKGVLNKTMKGDLHYRFGSYHILNHHRRLMRRTLSVERKGGSSIA